MSKIWKNILTGEKVFVVDLESDFIAYVRSTPQRLIEKYEAIRGARNYLYSNTEIFDFVKPKHVFFLTYKRIEDELQTVSNGAS